MRTSILLLTKGLQWFSWEPRSETSTMGIRALSSKTKVAAAGCVEVYRVNPTPPHPNASTCPPPGQYRENRAAITGQNWSESTASRHYIFVHSFTVDSAASRQVTSCTTLKGGFRARCNKPVEHFSTSLPGSFIERSGVRREGTGHGSPGGGRGERGAGGRGPYLLRPTTIPWWVPGESGCWGETRKAAPRMVHRTMRGHGTSGTWHLAPLNQIGGSKSISGRLG